MLRDEHSELSFFRILGPITKAVKIFSEKDCKDKRQLRCWNETQAPLVYIEGEIIDSPNHPNGQSCAELIRFVNQQPDCLIKIGYSVDGGITKREGPKLAESFATSVAVTVKPCNKTCKLYMENDLQKSLPLTNPPPRYFEALKKSEATSSFNFIPEAMLVHKLSVLKKSLADFAGAMTHVKCEQCGTPTRFFKSSSDLPNSCPKCANSFSMAQLWKAMKE